MISRKQSSGFSFSNSVVISIVALIFTLLTFSSISNAINHTTKADSSIFTVVIDVGHGGQDIGGNKGDISEKDLVLAISQAIKQVKVDPSIELIYTRNSDTGISLEDRVQVAKINNANLFISLHIDHNPNEQVGGLEVYYSDQNPNSRLSEDYSTFFAKGVNWSSNPSSIKKADFLVLKESMCPAVLLNIGFISNSKDLEYLISEGNQQSVANRIVQTISDISKM